MTSGLSILAAAREAVTERAGTYGAPEDLFAAIAQRWSLTLRHKLSAPVTAADVAACMIDLKVERALAGPTPDTFVDIAGYAACWAEVAP